jgi:hypothetical protein
MLVVKSILLTIVWNLTWGRGLVRKSVSWSWVLTWETSKTPFETRSWTKCRSITMCLIRECMTWLRLSWVTPVLSQYKLGHLDKSSSNVREVSQALIIVVMSQKSVMMPLNMYRVTSFIEMVESMTTSSSTNLLILLRYSKIDWVPHWIRVNSSLSCMTRVREWLAYNHCNFNHTSRAVEEMVISGRTGSKQRQGLHEESKYLAKTNAKIQDLKYPWRMIQLMDQTVLVMDKQWFHQDILRGYNL